MNYFTKRILEANAADPVAELAKMLFVSGWTEKQLEAALKAPDLRCLGNPFKVNLRNKMRDIVRKVKRYDKDRSQPS